jgi:multiple sugar transport system substrate-binding protein
MADTADDWKKITRRTSEDKIIDAIKANMAAWPWCNCTCSRRWR